MRGFALVIALLPVGPLSCSPGSSALDVGISGDVFEFPLSPDAPSVPLADVEICYEQTCDTTNAEGLYSVMVPAQSEVSLTYSRAGYGPLLIAITTENQSTMVNAEMLADATLEAFAVLLDTPYPTEGTGLIAITVYSGLPIDNDPIPGVSFTLVDAEGRSYYLDDNNLPTTELTQTAEPGVGGFVEVPPGTVRIALEGAVGCVGVTTWAEEPASEFTIPVREGFLTQAVISCE